jgi:CubicO group peptidase (beta-lactamase class C family)
MKKFLVVVFFLVTGLGFALPQRNTEKLSIDRARLEKSIDRLAHKYNIPDFAIAIVYEDSLWFTYDKIKENAGKNYLIGSCSKSFTALAIMRLVEEGVIDLDKPVKAYLPWFEMKNAAYSGKVTVRHLLNQKSGIERQYGFFDVRTASASDFEKGLAGYIRRIDVRVPPGSTFLYSNLNYILLGLIVQHTTGHRYADYLSSYLMPEMGMTHTSFTLANNVENNLISPYQYSICFLPVKSRSFYYSDFIVPAGYVSSNITDISTYLRLWLNNMITEKGDTLVSARGYKWLTGEEQTGYAMGWFRYISDSMEIVNHSGLNENFSSLLSFCPGRNLGIAILCNVNSLEFCGRVDQEIQSVISGKPVRNAFFSMEKMLRWGTFLIPLLLLMGLIYNLARWRKNYMGIGLVKGLIPNLRLISGIGLSLWLVIGVTHSFQMHLSKAIRFSPDIGWGLLLIAIFGITSSLMRYFGTYSIGKNED